MARLQVRSYQDQEACNLVFLYPDSSLNGKNECPFLRIKKESISTHTIYSPFIKLLHELFCTFSRCFFSSCFSSSFCLFCSFSSSLFSFLLSQSFSFYFVYFFFSFQTSSFSNLSSLSVFVLDIFERSLLVLFPCLELFFSLSFVERTLLYTFQ